MGIRGLISRAWQIQGWPTLYVIDDRGVIRYKFLGGGKEREIDQAIETLLKEIGG